MNRRILDEEIIRRIAKALLVKEQFLVDLAADMTGTLESDSDDAFLACQRERIYKSAANTLEATSSIATAMSAFTSELARSAQRGSRSISVGRSLMADARIVALAEAVELLQAVQGEVEQSA